MNLRLRDKLLLGYGLSVVLLGVIAGVGLWATERVSRSFEQVAHHTFVQSNALGDLRAAGLRVVSSVNEYGFIVSTRRRGGAIGEMPLAAQDEADLIATGSLNMDRAVRRFELASRRTDADLATVAELRRLERELVDGSAWMIELLNRPDTPAAELLEAKEELEQREREFLGRIGELQATRSSMLEVQVQAVHEATNLEYLLLLFAALSGVLIALGAAVFVSRRVAEPLARATEAANRIAGGDLSVRLETRSADEIGGLARAFNQMVEDLQNTTVSRDYLDRVIGTMSEALLVVDNTFRIIAFNRAALELTRRSERELRETSVTRLLRTPLRDRRGAARAQLLLESLDSRCECVLTLPDGRETPCLLSGAQMHDRNDSITGVVLILRDITDIKNAERQLIEARDRAQYATQSKSAFLANMSHELRTPLNGLLGNAELLSGTELSPRQAQLLGTVLASGENLLQVINDVLDFSKIEAGKLSLSTETIDLRRLVGDTVRALSETAFAKNVELLCDIRPDEELQVLGDALRIRQVLTNLIGNAVKFTERGEILVRLRRGESRSMIRFEVEDSGVGVPRDLQQVIFESFAQVGANRSGGTGLGLAVSRQLVELMGGEIGVHSEPGEGATFWFTCRLPAAGTEPSVGDEGVLRGLRVLLAESNESGRRILGAMLNHWQCGHTAVGNLRQARECLRQASVENSQYDLVLLEAGTLLEGGRDWIETMSGIRARGDGPRLGVLGGSREETRLPELAALGMMRFVRKPVLQAELLRQITEMTGIEPGATAAATDAAPTTAAAAPPEPPAVHARVLVVDDNAVNRYLVEDILQQAGCQVSLAETGHAGMRMLASGTFDIVLMDCQLPDIDGEEVTRRLRIREKSTGGRRVPVIALTANALEGDRERCLAAGMDDFLSKPFRQRQLLDTLRRWLRRSGATAAGSE